MTAEERDAWLEVLQRLVLATDDPRRHTIKLTKAERPKRLVRDAAETHTDGQTLDETLKP